MHARTTFFCHIWIEPHLPNMSCSRGPLAFNGLNPTSRAALCALVLLNVGCGGSTSLNPQGTAEDGGSPSTDAQNEASDARLRDAQPFDARLPDAQPSDGSVEASAHADANTSVGDGAVEAEPAEAAPEASPTDASGTLTVYDIQDVTSPLHPPENSSVALTGLEVTFAWWDTARINLWVREPLGGAYAAIRVYAERSDCYPDPSYAAGDVVDVVGKYHEYFGFSEIVADSIEVVGSVSAPTPLQLVAPITDLEPYEGDLVQLCGACAVVAQLDYGEINTSCIRLDDRYHLELQSRLSTGDELGCITGLVDYAYDTFRLLPRDDRDLQCTGGPCSGGVTCQPNCDGKCLGAWDGCGGHCPATTCPGCCRGTACLSGGGSSACGGNGGTCWVCNDCEVCQEGDCIS